MCGKVTGCRFTNQIKGQITASLPHRLQTFFYSAPRHFRVSGSHRFSVKSDRPVGTPRFRTIAGEDEEVPKKGNQKKKNRKKNVTHFQGTPLFPRFEGNGLMLIGVYLLRLTFSAT